jgi:hypothetical protein
MTGRYGPSTNDIVKVDASILAARAIDATYTPFGPLKSSPVANVQAGATPHHTTHQINWTGVYLGGERIWLGDAVRLRMSTNEDVLVVDQIIERPAQFNPAPGHGAAAAPTKVLLTGNIFSCSTLPADAVPADRQHLIPARMRDDLEARNRSIQAIRGPKSYWKLIQSGHAVDLADVKGRWYETSIMRPIVAGQTSYDECVRQGETDSVARSFNPRVEMNRTAGHRFDSRQAAFGRAVPEHTRLMEGLDAPPSSEVPSRPQPQQPPAAQQHEPQQQQIPIQSNFDTQMGGQQEHGDGSLVDQFMDLDGIEGGNSMPGFGQEYGSQANFFP